MANEQLTDKEKAILIGSVDAKSRNDFNEEFYNLMKNTLPPAPDQIDDRIRRSISRFYRKAETDEETALLLSHDNPNSVLQGRLTVAWLHGYMVARKWRKPILRDRNIPQRGE